MAQVIEVSLLGPPRVERDKALVVFETRKAMAMLAILAVSGRGRTRDALVELFWPESDPDHGRAALRRTLSDLRGGIGAELVETTSDQVRLVTGPDLSVDVDRFRDLCARGELGQAVELCRGDFLEGLAVRNAPDFEDWVELENEDLRRQLVGALEGLTGERENAGDLLGATAAARRWLSIDPLHEPAHRALIRLYAARGDRAAAIEQYRTCVRTLSRELGVPPLRETTRLYEAVSRGTFVTETVPEASAEVSASPGPPPLPFVGRAAQLREARGVYGALAGDGAVVLVEGEAGIGKTRLADELLGWVRRRGGRVLAGRAYEEERYLAYSPVVEALRQRLREDDEWLETLDDRTRGEAARLVPELASGTSAVGALRGPGAETRFLSALWDVLVAATAGPRPGALLLDDVHWADDATLALLSYGLRRLAGRPFLLVLTWRTPHDHALRRRVTAVTRSGAGVTLRLDRLAEEDVDTLLHAAQPAAEAFDAASLWGQTEGVPLMVVEYLRGPAAEGGRSVPTGVRDVLEERLDPVSETGRQVLSAAAVIGRAFDLETVRAVSGRTEEETVTAVEEVVRRGLVTEDEHGYDFAHHLLRETVYDTTSLARRRLLHGRAAEVPGMPAATAARHLQLAGRDAAAAEAYRAAGEQARAVFANAEALDHFRAALALGHPDQAGLHTAIGDLQTVLGDYTGALASLETAAATCRPDELAGVEQRLGRLQYRRGEYAQARARLEAALAAAPTEDLAGRAGILVDLSLAAESCGDVARAEALAAEARAGAEAAGETSAVCQALNRLGMLATAHGDLAGAVDRLVRCCRLAEQIGDEELHAAALNNLALAYRARGDLDDAVRHTQEALALCTRMGDRHHEAALENNLADVLQASGRHEEAMVHLKRAVEIFADIGAEEEPHAGVWRLVRW
jgi:DNA-binding SARP family transcriptional activator